MNIDFFTKIIPWISETSFFLGLLPRIILNYKIKSVNGLSDLYLVFYFSGYAFNLFYVYGLDLPMAYKVTAPLCLLAVGFIIFQKSIYDNIFSNFKIAKLYYTDFLLFLFFIPLIFMFPQEIGHLAGWMLIVVWTLYQFPQIVKIYRKKSVVGLSFMLVTLIGLGNLVEFIVAIIFNLPIQTFFITIRGMIFYLVYCFEFWIYKKNQDASVQRIRIFNQDK